MSHLFLISLPARSPKSITLPSRLTKKKKKHKRIQRLIKDLFFPPLVSVYFSFCDAAEDVGGGDRGASDNNTQEPSQDCLRQKRSDREEGEVAACISRLLPVGCNRRPWQDSTSNEVIRGGIYQHDTISTARLVFLYSNIFKDVFI